ncbi:acylphosphatase-2 isoform X2 [Drosophila ficusphila]|uniref:acylphosphatase-2 isoform X2 n=1 Tax=Drosophila ficusphila TaxID=30025 RepID=UPI0007E64506|nr:acylphosphatase-2 isoform X2 [Drosophila ficusphila]
MSSKISKSKSTSSKPVASSAKTNKNASGECQVFTCQFEVFGHVQGVFFRKANELGITGWCMNTTQGTVKGMLEGSLDQLTDMKYWLQHKGSPRSVIEKAVFSENESLPINNFKLFSIRR